jgi:hypothetical protein
MAKLYRRTWEKWAYGRGGAISSPLDARSGTDGAISGAATSTPVAIMTSASANFQSTDVGRLIRLTGTPSNRFDGVFIIDSINSTTSVNLRYNHNTGCPASPARFMQTGTGITWRIHESCTFTADAAGDFGASMAGSFIAIEGATQAANNNGLWRISHYVDSQHVILSKSYLFWVADATSYTTYTSDSLLSFSAETSITWAVVDREPINGPDLHQLYRQFLIDIGFSLWQHRGPVSANNILVDEVFRSVGETDATNLPSGRITYLRVVAYLHGRSAVGIGTQYNIYAAPFHAWDVTLTATSPGSGIGGMKINPSSGAISVTPTPTTGSTQAEMTLDNGTGQVDIVSQGRAGLPFNLYRRDMVMFGDADEWWWFVNNSGLVNSWATVGMSCLNNANGIVACNPYTGVITAVSTTTQFNTGTVDFAAKGYAVGDKIAVRGMSAGTPEYIETTTITSFDNSDTSNRKINVSALSRTYGNGTDGTVRAYLGVDPFPVAGWYSTNSTPSIRLHNQTALANAPGRDYDSTNFGVTGTLSNSVSLSECRPNRRSGRYTMSAMHVKIASVEHRGKFKYMQAIDNGTLTQGKKLRDPSNNDIYIALVISQASSTIGIIGPMPLQMAGVKL